MIQTLGVVGAGQMGSGIAHVSALAGLHVVLQLLDDNPGETEIIRRAEQQGIRLFPFAATFVTGETASTNILLGFGGLTAGEIEQGVKLLSQLCW